MSARLLEIKVTKISKPKYKIYQNDQSVKSDQNVKGIHIVRRILRQSLSEKPANLFPFHKVNVPTPPGTSAASELNTSSQVGSIWEKFGGVSGVWVPHTGGVFGLSSHYFFRSIMKLAMV